MPKMFSMKFPLPVLSESIMFGCRGLLFPTNTTGYLTYADQGEALLTSYSASEAIVTVNYLVTRSGLLRNLVVRTNDPPGLGQTYTFTVRINGAPTTITCQISGAVDRGASDLVNTAEVVIGDRVTIELVSSNGASGTYLVASLGAETPSTRKPYEHQSFTTSTTVGAGLTRYLISVFRMGSYGTVATTIETATDGIHPISRKGTIKNFIVLSGSVPGAGQSFTYNLRINGINVLTITLSGAVTFTDMNTTNVVQVDAGDRVTLQLITSAGAAVTTHEASYDFEEGDYRAG